MADDLSIFMHAIRIQESGDNYNAYNRSSGASGAYQFTQGTWREALSAAGLGGSIGLYPAAYFAPPSVQDAAASQLMATYYNEFGHSWPNVAEAWYGGPGAVGHPGWGGGPGYPTVGQYAADVMAIYHRLGGSGGGGGITVIPNAIAGGSNFSADMADYYQHVIDPAVAASKQWALALHNVFGNAGGVLT